MHIVSVCMNYMNISMYARIVHMHVFYVSYFMYALYELMIYVGMYAVLSLADLHVTDKKYPAAIELLVFNSLLHHHLFNSKLSQQSFLSS